GCAHELCAVFDKGLQDVPRRRQQIFRNLPELNGQLPDDDHPNPDEDRRADRDYVLLVPRARGRHSIPLAIEALRSISESWRQRPENLKLSRKSSVRGCGSSINSSPKIRPGREAMIRTRVERNTAS